MGRILLKVFGVILMLFGLLMIFASSLQAVRASQLFPYLCSIVIGALLVNYKILLGYLSKSGVKSDNRVHPLALLCFGLGLAGIFGFWILSLSAFICGIIFLIMNKRNANVFQGNSAAIFGVIISLIWLCFYSVPLFYNPQKHWSQGDAYLRSGHYDRAIREYDETLKQEPQCHDVYFQRALAHIGKGDYDNAIADYTKRIESFLGTDPFFDREKAEVFIGRAKAYFRIQEYEKAWDDVCKAQSLGYKVDLDFIEGLKEALGREK